MSGAGDGGMGDMASISFVCCIESGVLEEQALLMLRTFRLNAGALKDSRILAFKPRRSTPLASSTLAGLQDLGVELVDDPSLSRLPWFNYANKVAAVRRAEELVDTELVAWLDSDILIAAEPTELLLPPDVDFAARGEFLPPAIHGDDPTQVPYWRAVCELFGVDLGAVPTITLDDRDLTIKMYLNSGVLVWRRSTGFGAKYHDAVLKLMRSRLAQQDGNFFTADQVVLSPLVVQQALRFSHLGTRCHHMMFQSLLSGASAAPHMGKSAIIHYSKSLSPEFRDQFLGRLAAELPAVHRVVEEHLASAGGAWSKNKTIGDSLLRAYRGLRWRLYAARIRRMPRG